MLSPRIAMVVLCWLVLTALSGSVLHSQSPVDADSAERPPFDAWLEGVRAEALARGISPEIVASALDGVAPVQRIVQRDRNQTEFRLTLDQYLQRRLTTATVRMARRMSAKYPTLLGRVSKAYGVDPPVIVAIWGLESNFGRFRGVRPTIPTLATLAWDGRRGEFFRGQLLDALTILDRGDITLPRLKGSWAGAMGQPQFLPSSYLAWAVDFDGNGNRDIWSTLPDVFASMANYLRGHGWTAGMPWGYEVTVPANARQVVEAIPARTRGCRASRELTERRPLAEWRAAGLTRKAGEALPTTDHEASLLEVDGRAFLVTVNYDALLGYNCAHTYALSVALLSDRIDE